ncbi:MAG: ferritin [Bacteroidetes bacterium]|jgi:ferritin|nr:ferritin [Bacteroidota bacterium]MBU1578321.1 ferritin [Bacteroidota bacterium]MBU2557434.1 ferritin [Bacteroidota bacterium]MDA3944893.1 ferritin [Bacteroidota bacterium]
MLNKKVEKAINEQIKKEEFSSRLYLSMAIWCEVNGFPGAASFLYRQSDEERMHQLKFVHYTNDRGGSAALMSLEKPEAEFNSLLEVFQKVMKHEQFITESINELYGITLEEKDYTTGNFLQWYINEQIEEESTMSTILDKISLVGNDKSGMFHIDKELEAMTAAAPAP